VKYSFGQKEGEEGKLNFSENKFYFAL